MVALGTGVSLPEGLEVTVVVPAAPEAGDSLPTTRQQNRLREARRQIESLPNENPGDTFSGADHDRVLYGDE
jgi:hypothetical protein